VTEIEFRLPSKVPYGYANVRFEVEGVPDAEYIANMYANYVMAFAEAERSALNAYGKPSEAPTAPPVAKVDQESTDEENVHETAVQAVKELGATKIDEYNFDGPGDVDAAASEVGDVVTVAGMNFTKVGESPFPEHDEEPPWKKKAEPQAKPWEEKAAPDVATEYTTSDIADVDW
jgi:hypothetical protein